MSKTLEGNVAAMSGHGLSMFEVGQAMVGNIV
jgi:hypothetical protein